MTVLTKTRIVRTKTEFNFIGTVYKLTNTLNIYPLNVNWCAFLKGILLTLQSPGWNNGIHGGCQLGSGDLPPTSYVAHWCVIGHCVGIMVAYGMSQIRVFVTSHHIPSQPNPTPPTLPPIPLTPSISNTDGWKGKQWIPWNSAIIEIYVEG